ncbi:MAG: alpha/beta hydrolase [Rhodothermales bacterium]|nr:alpha/beta hydrolase [Rhodothermales bacterium]
MRSLVVLVLALAAAGCGPAASDEQGVREVNGTQLFVREMGSGAPVLVVHGGPLMEHGYFLPHLTPLADDFRLVFYDQRMSGRTPVDSVGGVSMALLLQDMDALRADEGVEQIHVIGHSWGGHLAMRYAMAYPERLRSLVLSNPMAGSRVLWMEEEAELAARASDADRAERQAIMATPAFSRFDPAAIDQLMRVSFRVQFADTARMHGLSMYFPDDYADRSSRFGALFAEMMAYDFHDALGSFEAPTLLVYGEEEPAATIGGVALLEALPNAEIVLVPDAGHFPFIEQPDEWLEAVGGFLKVR